MKSLSSLVLSILILVLMSSCEHKVSTETTVHPDGSLDKTIIVEDSAKYLFNLQTWDKEVLSPQNESVDSGRSIKVFTSFHKKFNSAAEANAELAAGKQRDGNAVFGITSKFEKKFKWFYSYIYYSDTYHRINRMIYPVDDFLTPEDFAFIDRLPAEGSKISKADSLYLVGLNDRLFDGYATKAFFTDYYNLGIKLIKDNQLDPRWIDSLRHHSDNIYQQITNKKDLDKDFLLKAMDSLKIPLDYKKVKPEYDTFVSDMEKKLNFITMANDGKYVNRINLPWDVVNTNADSVSGNTLIWSPPTIKFLLKDYTMYGECRKLNWWAVIVSLGIIGLTGYLFVRKSN